MPPFSIKDIIDLLLVALIFYQLYRLLRGSVALNIFIGFLLFIACWFLVTSVWEMRLLGAIFDKVVGVLGVLLVVLFQDEIRRFFFNFGTRKHWKIFNFFKRMFGSKQTENNYYEQVGRACILLSKSKTGALMVIKRGADLNNYIETGERTEAILSSRLIENIFFKNSPLHDGAMIIDGNSIVAVGCILPISHNQNLPRHLGLRHRSAVGISEKTDAFTVVVSEETGFISIAEHGELRRRISLEELQEELKNIDIK
jgi:uncharacterized protein (TIGR00159 family)